MVDLTLIQWVDAHGLIVLVCYYIMSSAVSALDAPTATSGGFYRWFFKFANAFGANISRAFSTTIEKSPNWPEAVKRARSKPPEPEKPDAKQ
jgi:hypothetical protein